jgi:ComF family protein
MPVSTKRLRTELTAWTQRLWPLRCLLCGAPGHGLDLCQPCQADLPRNQPCCPRCALPRPSPAHLCRRCARETPPWDSAWAPFRYAWPLDLLESRFKFHGELACGRVLAALWARQPPPSLPDVVVAVPLHVRRLRQRGFNQAAELLHPLAAALGVPLVPGALARVRATVPQSEQDAATRRRNVHGAFAAQGVAGLRVAVVDDVMTTGATLGDCARALRLAGAIEVQAWALARA